MSGNGDSGKSQGPSDRPSSASRMTAGASATSGSASSCIQPRWMYVRTTMVVMAMIVLVLAS